MKPHLLTAGLLLGLTSSFQSNLLPFQVRVSDPPPLTLCRAASDESAPPSPNLISIEYCTGCRWMLKAFWTAQELLTTFEDDLDAVTVVPSASKGIYSVVLNGDKKLWDRKEQGGFPSPKSLKQIVRDIIEPEKFLGHADTEERQESYAEETESEADSISIAERQSPLFIGESEAPSPSVTITYCVGCKWLLRAAYFGQELLTTFGEEIKSVSLVPSKPPAKGGAFSVHLDGELIFDRGAEGRFPEVKELKQLIRDKVVPDKDLGHSDVVGVQDIIQDQIDEGEAIEQRRFFGVD